MQRDVARQAGVESFQLIDAFVMTGGQPRHQRPVLNRSVIIIRNAVKQLLVSGNGLINLPGHAQQTSLLQLLATIAGAAFHFVTRGFQLGRFGRQLRQTLQLLLRAGGIALAEKIAHPRGNNVRVIRVDQFQAIERLAHQILTFAGLAEADLLQ